MTGVLRGRLQAEGALNPHDSMSYLLGLSSVVAALAGTD